METKGKVVGVIPNWLNEQDIVTIQVRLELPYTFDNLESLDGLKDKDIKVSLTQWREPRSRSANGYFYVLVGKLADALRVSKPYIHNLMLRKYGQLERIDGRPVWVILPETDEIANKVDEDETLHVRPTDEVKTGKDGKLYRTYVLLKGSHQLNSKEMTVLLDGIISECREVGVETATPEEIERMKQMWGIEGLK